MGQAAQDIQLEAQVQAEEDTAFAVMAAAYEDEQLEDFRRWRDHGFDLLSVQPGAAKWVPGAKRIIKRGERQSWVAREGEGKTQAAMHLAAQVCEAGGRVMYVDVENDRQEMGERLIPIARAWGAEDAVMERLVYLPDLKLGAVLESDELQESFISALAQVDLLVIDSWTRVLNSFGMDENKNQDIARFMESIVDPVSAFGIAVLILDNTGKKGEEARGAVSKRALVESVYNVTGGKGIKPPNPDDPDNIGRHGKLELKLDRSRSGKLADYVTAGSGGGEYDRLTAQDGEAPGKRDSERDVRRQLIRARFRDHPDEVYDKEALRTLTGASAGTIVEDLKVLAAEGWIVRAPGVPGDRKQYWMIDPANVSQ
jgi:hypothetical protein